MSNTRTMPTLLDPVSQSLFLNIADITIHIKTKDLGMRHRIDEAMKKFLVEDSKPDVNVTVQWKDFTETVRGRKIFDSGALWKLYDLDGSYLFAFTSEVLGASPYKVAVFNREFTEGRVDLSRSCYGYEPIYPLEYPLDELLLTHYLSRGRGVEIHGCGVIVSLNEGYLFAGPSEAGKTTMARLWQRTRNAKILSDDRIILRKQEDKVWMYGTPWHGEGRLALAERVPLSKIFFLQHGERNELLPERSAAAISQLFTCSFVPLYDKEAIDFTLAFLEEIAGAISCYGLSFLPDDRVVGFLEKRRSKIEN